MDGNTENPPVAFEAVSDSIRTARFPADAKAVIGILRGGRVPACLIAHHLRLPLQTVRIRFRDDSNEPLSEAPVLVGPGPKPETSGGSVLLVDDVSVSGATLAEARRHLGGSKITTVVLKGKADIVLMPDLPAGCVDWPWNEDRGSENRPGSKPGE